MNQYHKQYPIGSRWLLPVTVAAHLEPDHDDYDPRPIKFIYTADAAPIYPRVRDLKHLIHDKELAFALLVETGSHWCVSYKGNTVASFDKNTHPFAKDAAREECDRLNAN